jgi:hypothetical protein
MQRIIRKNLKRKWIDKVKFKLAWNFVNLVAKRIKIKRLWDKAFKRPHWHIGSRKEGFRDKELANWN